MTTTETTFAPLTRESIQFLRKARAITFRHDSLRDGGTISAYIGEGKNETEMVLRVDSRISNYGSSFMPQVNEYTKCFTTWLYSHMNPNAHAILSVMRPGDVLTLIWVGGNNTHVLEEHKLDADELHIRITRKAGNKVNHFEFLANYGVAQVKTQKMVGGIS